MFYEVEKPEAGDLLRVKRDKGYYHFGIATSENTVVHFTGNESDLSTDEGGIMIRETSLAKFLKNGVLQSKSHELSCYSQEELVARARKYVGKPTFNRKKYNFLTNNCEHFARYVFEGKPKSKQAEKGKKILVTGAAILGAALTGAVTTAAAIVSSKKKNK